MKLSVDGYDFDAPQSISIYQVVMENTAAKNYQEARDYILANDYCVHESESFYQLRCDDINKKITLMKY